MNMAMMWRTAIVLVSLAVTAAAVRAGRHRIRFLEARHGQHVEIDRVLNLWVRSTAAVLLAAIFGWVAVGHEPPDPEGLSGRLQSSRECTRYAPGPGRHVDAESTCQHIR